MSCNNNIYDAIRSRVKPNNFWDNSGFNLPRIFIEKKLITNELNTTTATILKFT